MKEIPKTLVNNLEPKIRKAVLILVREFSKPIAHHLGIDQTEEEMLSLLDKGELKIFYDEDTELFSLAYYEEEIDDYIQINGEDDDCL